MPLTVAAAGPARDFVYQSVELAPFVDSRTYELVGKKARDGTCSYRYPELVVPAGRQAWSFRVVGIDHGRCVKLVEEGVATVEEEPGGDRTQSEVLATGEPSAPFAVTAVHSGYHRVWWEDILGLDMTVDTTYISWSTNGSCVTGGSASGEWSWITGTGWQLVSKGGTGGWTCSRYLGETRSTFKNSWFCSPLPTVWTYYYYVRAYGWADGHYTSSKSTDSVNECAPFWLHADSRQTG